MLRRGRRPEHRAAFSSRARRAVSRWCPSSPLPSDPQLARACWPRPFEATVTEAARAHGLDPLLPYAIMLAESDMDPEVTSAAGARGLMQIMPAEGGRLHDAAHAAGRYDPDRLYHARYNALLGTTELGLKREALGGVLTPDPLPAVIASYNAGEAAVRSWLPTDGAAASSSTFAEDIPYTETRRYVRTVLGYHMAWRLVWGDTTP